MLTNEQVKEFQKLYQKHFGEKISIKDAHKNALTLVCLVKILIKSKEKIKEEHKNYEIQNNTI